MLRTKIVCTIGPASRDPSVLREMLVAGMNVARLNFSHGDQQVHGENIQNLRSVATEVGIPVAILVDLQGPKLRIGDMGGKQLQIAAGDALVLTSRPGTGRPAGKQPAVVPLQYAGLPRMVRPGDRILIDDGLLEVEVVDADEVDIRCRVITGGRLRSNKGLNLPNASVDIPAITTKDWSDLAFSLAAGADWIALSFVRSAAEVDELKGRIADQCQFGRPVPVVAKIEKPEAVDAIDSILSSADAIMVARGDLGIETAPEKVPMIQKSIIAKCNAAGMPVITATQMLDSMMRNPRPTRAEASDVANAILDGTDAIMLSGETAAGRYPLEALRTMVNIAREVEDARSDRWEKPGYIHRPVASVTEAVSHATCETAHDLGAAAIVSATASGRTAMAVARYRPRCPIIAVTPSPMVQRRLLLVQGVWPLLGRPTADTDQMLDGAISAALASGLIDRGDTVVITAGVSPNMPGSTDLMKVERIPQILGRGSGVLERVICGRVRRLDPIPDGRDVEIQADDILVVSKSNRRLVPLARRAAGLITQEEGAGSHAQSLALEIGVPAILGVTDALRLLRDGMEITIDTRQGVILAGKHGDASSA